MTTFVITMCVIFGIGTVLSFVVFVLRAWIKDYPKYTTERTIINDLVTIIYSTAFFIWTLVILIK